MTRYHLDPSTLTIWRIRVLLLSLLLLTISVWGFSYPYLFLYIRTFTLIWLCVFLFFYAIYLPSRFKYFYCAIGESYLLLRFGVIKNISKAIPLSSILYTSTFSTPLQRLFGVSSARIYSAGNYSVIPGLSKKDIQLFQEQLTLQRNRGDNHIEQS